jgi:hypothetical protein
LVGISLFDNTVAMKLITDKSKHIEEMENIPGRDIV